MVIERIRTVLGWWRVFPDWLREHWDDSKRFLFVCIVVGVACGVVAVSFHLCIQWLFENVYHWSKGFSVGVFSVLMILAPTVGGLIAGVLLWKFPKARGSGIPQTKAAYYQNFGHIELKEGVARFVIGAISVGSGASLGREGPTVHICSAVASSIGRYFGLAKARVQAMVPVGFGAGVAAAFNAPISAITFVFEELLGDFSSKALGGIVIAVVIAASIERMILGENPVLVVGLPDFSIGWWMLVAIPLGVLSAWLGNLFVGAVLSARMYFRHHITLPVWAQPALGGLSVGILGMAVYWLTLAWTGSGSNGVFSIGHEDLNAVLDSRLTWLAVLLLLVGKFVATVLSYASGGSGGLFTPTLFIGSMLGALVGLLMQYFFDLPNEVVGACALLGMGGLFASVIRCPMTSFLIIFEMTRNYSLMLPLMACSSLSYVIASRKRAVPLYDSLLVQDKISLKKMPSYRGDRDWKNLPVSTIMTHDVITVFAHQTMQDVRDDIEARCCVHHGYPVIDEERGLIGMMMHHHLEEQLLLGNNYLVGTFIADQQLITVCPGDSIREVAKVLIEKDVLQVPVVSSKDRSKLLGLVTLHDIARQQNAIDETIGR